MPPSPALLQTLRHACSILFQIQIYASSENMEDNPQWLQKLLKCCKSSHISVCLLSTEIFLSFILKRHVEDKGPYYQIKSIVYSGEKDKAELEHTEYLKSLQGKKDIH
jgi:inorganic triphosphatase YgiF